MQISFGNEGGMNNFINFANENMTVCNGEYFAVDVKEFDLIIKKDTDTKGVISLGREYSTKDVVTFLTDSYDCIKKGNFILMSKRKWIAAKLTKGKNAGEDLKVQNNGTIWTYKPNMKALVFVRKTK